MNVVQLSKRLVAPPVVVQVPGIELRNYRGPEDIGPWLELRHAAFARESVGVRQWTADDFAAEFLHKPWWRPERMWLAETTEASSATALVGAVTLASRGQEPDSMPAIHWLIVHPRWRRRGIAGLLIGALESSCWAAGQHEIHLETHARWQSARHFYTALGYSAMPGS